MSMKFNPYYGYSVKDSSGLDYNQNKKLIDFIQSIYGYAGEEEEDGPVDDSIFDYQLFTEDEFSDYTDLIYGVETYDIHNDMKKFDAMNTGDTSFVNTIKKHLDYARQYLNDNGDIQMLEDYYNRIKTMKLVACIYQVYI